MQRREFITLFGGSVATWSFAARAQQPARLVYRVGYLSLGSIGSGDRSYAMIAFEQGLRSLGYSVGENVVIEYRFAHGEMERLPALAAEPDGMVLVGSSRQPFLDAARVLIAAGYDPDSWLEGWRPGATAFALRARLGIA